MVRMALVGCGGMADWHAKELASIPQVQVTALVDVRPERTRLFREKHFPQAAEYASFGNLLEIPATELDAVVLVTPHTLHYPQAKAALEKGWHVLVEKPMVTRSDHAYDLWRTVQRSGRQLAITFQAPYTPEFTYLAGERDAGRLGKVQLISGWLAQGWLKGTIGTWRQQPALSGGGQMYDSGAHVLNSIMWLMNDPVVEVACFYDACGSPVDINGVAIMKFQNGAMGSVAIGGNSPGWDTEIKIQTDRYQIHTRPHGGWLEVHADGRKHYPAVQLDDRPAGGTPHRNFISALLGEEPLRAPVRYGVLLSALMDALYESAARQQPVQVTPVPRELND